jgi:hypothetical protein
MQEQQKHILWQDSVIASLLSQNQKTINNDEPVIKTDVTLSSRTIVLDQNKPNPFKDNTVIPYEIKKDFTNAMIVFTDEIGTVIKEVPITQKGKGQLNVFASDLTSGIYTYTIVVDGITIASKKMVKTK